MVIDLGLIPAFPYSRLGYRRNMLKKYEFVYDGKMIYTYVQMKKI